MDELKVGIIMAIKAIKSEKNKEMFTFKEIYEKIGGVKKKELSEAVKALIANEKIKIVVYEPICMMLKEDYDRIA